MVSEGRGDRPAGRPLAHMPEALETPPVWDRPWDRIEVGERFSSGPIAISADDVLRFADLTGDRHPVHVDPEWAERSRFGGLIAHGLLVLSLAIGAFPFGGSYVVALRRIREAVFKRPVPAGDQVEAVAEVAGKTPVDSASGIVTIACTVRDDAGRTVLRWEIDVLWRREER